MRLPKDVYQRLHKFSVAANKKQEARTLSTRSDGWIFLSQSTKTVWHSTHINASRRLVEVEGWDSEQALRLAEEYEFGLELLQRRRRAS